METTDAQPSDSSPSYEFSADQNEVIGKLAAAMQWVAIPLIIVGILYAISAVAHFAWVFQDWSWRVALPVLLVGLGGVLYLVLGIWTKRAAASFSEVVSTTGSDVAHLMTALDNLRKTYSLLSLFVKIYVALLAIGLIFTAIGLLARFFK